MIRLAVPDIDDDDLAAVADVLRSGYLVQGARVAAFEAAVAEQCRAAHAVAVSSCTAALHLALLALGVGPGDRVAVPTYSWPATANVVVVVGAEPVFVEIEPDTMTMAPAALAAVMADGRGPLAAIIPVHAFGGMADMAAIGELAARGGVPVIEDAACALGATLDGRPAGSFGRVGCFSFHPRKAVTTGEGGVLVTEEATVGRAARTLRNHGLDPDASSPTFIAAGYNLRMTDLQGALGCTQVAKLGRVLAQRRQLAACYDEALAAPRLHELGVRAPVARPGSEHAYQSYVVHLPAWAGADPAVRAALIGAMAARGIETTIGTYHLPLIAFFAARGHRVGDFPVTDDIAARALTLPLSGAMSPADVTTVVDALGEELGSLAASRRAAPAQPAAVTT